MQNIKSLLALRLLLIIAVLYTLLILYGSLVSPKSLPRISHNVSDKSLHSIGYFFLFVLWFLYAFFKTRRKSFLEIVLKIIVFGLLFGIIIEILQGSLTATREPDLYDVLANFYGLAIAGIVIVMFKSKLIKLKNNISL